MNDSDDPYKILGVSRESSASEIRSAYRKLALRHHPDKQTTDEDRQRCNSLFAKISNAYEILGDESRKREFDLETDQQTQFQNHNNHHHFHHFHDPFQVFQEVFGQEFGTMPRGSRRGGGGMTDPFFQDPFFADPFGGSMFQQHQAAAGGFGGFGGFGGGMFGGSMFGRGFGGDDIFSQMNQRMEMMQQQHFRAAQQQQQQQQQQPQQQQQNRGGQYYYSSSTSSSSSIMGGGGSRESVSTSTRIINGKRQTVTERVVTKPDGTVERHVETSGDDDFPQLDQSHPWYQQQAQVADSPRRRQLQQGEPTGADRQEKKSKRRKNSRSVSRD